MMKMIDKQSIRVSSHTHQYYIASEDIELLILQIYTVWALYLILPISIIKNEVIMRPM